MPEQPIADEVVRLDNLTKTYGEPGTATLVHALRGLSMTVRQGEYVAIVGTSGSGKSTLLNILGCLDRPTSGTYHLYGRDVSRLSDDQLADVRGERIGFIFQNFNLIQTQTVLENLEVPGFYQGVSPETRRERALRIADRVGLSERLLHRPTQLSGGQQQRVAIARSLMNDPVMLLADEPTGNLDTATGRAILELLDEVNAEGMTLLVVTHDRYVADHCGRVVEMSDGRIAVDRATR